MTFLDFLTHTKAFFLTSWAFIKKYSTLISVILFSIVLIIFAWDKNKQIKELTTLMETISSSHRKEIDDIQKARDEEIKKRQEEERLYQQTLARIELEHKEALENLDRAKKAEIRNLIAQFQDDPDKMSAAINALLGIPVSPH